MNRVLVSCMNMVPIIKILFTLTMVILMTSNFSNVSAQGTGGVTVTTIVETRDGTVPFQPNQFQITVDFNPGGPQTLPGSSSGQRYTESAPSTYQVLFETNLDIDATFSPESECGNLSPVTLNPGDEKKCTVAITVFGGTNEMEGAGTASPNIPLNQTTEVVNRQSGLSVVPGKGMAPFDKCVAPNLEVNSSVKIIHAPSSASYTIDGTTSIRELFESLQDNNELTIMIFQDRRVDDGVLLGVASPAFTGQLFVGEDPELFPSDAVRYNIDDISTKCDYITLTDPISQNPQVRFSPLANTSEIKTGSLDFNGDPTTNHIPNELLPYCAEQQKVSDECILTNELNKIGFSNSVINPPFRSCSDALFNSQGQNREPEDAQSWAQYIIKGNVGLIPTQSFIDLVSGDSTGQFIIKLVSDLILLNTDEVKIADSNNPFMTVYFIVNPDEPTATRIPFTIQKVSTQCNAADFIEDPQIN